MEKTKKEMKPIKNIRSEVTILQKTNDFMNVLAIRYGNSVNRYVACTKIRTPSRYNVFLNFVVQRCSCDL